MSAGAAGPGLDPAEIYRVRSEQDPTAVIALEARVSRDHVSWFDTGRDRGHKLRAVRAEGERVVVETDRGWVYSFEPLTKEIYDREVKAQVELSPEFGSTEELRAFYRNFLATQS